MKFNIYSLMFFLLVQILTPFVLISGTIAQAKDGMLLVCTPNGYQWVKPTTDLPSPSSQDKSTPSCPLCLIDFDSHSDQLGFAPNPQFAITNDVDLFAVQILSGYLDKSIKTKLILLYDILGRAPPLDLIS